MIFVSRVPIVAFDTVFYRGIKYVFGISPSPTVFSLIQLFKIFLDVFSSICSLSNRAL